MQLRCILFRLLGVVLIVGGSIGAFFFSFSYFFLIIFTLVIIAGATLWIVANPQRYNERISGSSMVPCGDDITNEQLYKILCTLPTPLGTPHLAKVRGFKKPIIVYGSQSDTYIYLVYHARTFDFFYVSTIYSFSLLQILPDDNVRSDEEAADSINQEFAYYLYTITSTVEKAVSLAGRE